VDDDRGITHDMIIKIDQGHLGPPCRSLECWKLMSGLGKRSSYKSSARDISRALELLSRALEL
jgi:hypothetical protein